MSKKGMPQRPRHVLIFLSPYTIMKLFMLNKTEKGSDLRGNESLDALPLSTSVPAWYDFAGASYVLSDDWCLTD